MYTYRKIKVSCVECPKRFYRIMYVRNDLNLFQIGVGILISLQAEFDHMFLFRDKKFSYMDASWIANAFSPRYSVLDYTKVHLSDLTLNASNEFMLEYDTGDGWDFTIKLYKAVKQFGAEEERYGIVTEAKGDRIWEDYHYAFDEYLAGRKVDESEEGRPWNIPDDLPLSFFNDEVSVDELNDSMYIAEDCAGRLLENYKSLQ